MDKPLTISKDAPEQKSMDYELLRVEGIKYIQNIAGKIWTDFNTHDPGVTILEVLCYALTDLGYRTSYDIKDLIAPEPEDGDGKEIHNFFTAAQILPNAPVTTNDYRKLMIDVVVESSDPGCSTVGVKNAWIEKAKGPEHNIYLNKKKSRLTYLSDKPNDLPLDIKILHNILLEFDRCDTFGDLNENKLIRDYTITDHSPDPELEGVIIRVDVEFPRWDNRDVDWDSNSDISQRILGIRLSFINLGGNFDISYHINSVKEVILSGTKRSPSGLVEIDGLNEITQGLNEFIFDAESSILQFYKQKIAKIREIVGRVKAKMHANRNLCEDFMQFNALRIEEILVCADIELEPDANVDHAQAEIYHEISRFLSPTVHFYSLEEMTNRCYDQYRHNILSIHKTNRTFTIEARLDPLPEAETAVTITGSNNNNGTYTVQEARRNRDNESNTDIVVLEAIPSDIVAENEQLIEGDPANEPCSPVEEIFEGPLLNHGFIDTEELEQADRKKIIYVSDLINIIMDIEGVAAVRNIQIANVPQDNEDGAIESKSVHWCLKLAFEENYVPRLTIDKSKITFFKDQLPFKASRVRVDEIMKMLREVERPQKIPGSGPFDIRPPVGEFKNPAEYTSIQNDFPLVYGIGEEGVPTRSERGRRSELPTQTDARQLKGYLMHFDQLLANYLSQLAHVKELFSMNPQRDEFGNYVIGRTYYTQPLFDIVPDAEKLYFDKPGHAADLNTIAESETQFWDRRNRFLDHLIARFAEQFTDYALLTNRISGAKAQDELIEDKLAFLNGYPELSSRRGTAMNYKSDCTLWHRDNVSGLENRALLLTGIDERPASTLEFHPRFKLTGVAPDIRFSIENDLSEELLQSVQSFETTDEAKSVLESVVAAGVHKHAYSVVTENGSEFFFELHCNGSVIAQSVKTDYTTDETEGDADTAISEVVELLRDEFFNNPESNRHNLACPLLNYFDVDISLSMGMSPPAFTIEYRLCKIPFLFDGADPVLTGEYSGDGPPREPAGITAVDIGNSSFTTEGQITEDLVVGDTVHIESSVDNDGIYTIASFTLDGEQTVITVEEPIPSDTSPLGTLLYNIIKEDELQELAEAAVHDHLWAVVANGVRRRSYRFTPQFPPFDSPYTFSVYNYRGNKLGESTEFDFNVDVVHEIEGVSNKVISVVEPGENPDSYDYILVSATARGPYIDVEIDSVPDPVPAIDWHLKISDSFSLSDIHQTERIFSVETDLTDRLSDGDSILITGHPSNNGTYTILSLLFDGTYTHFTVKEPIPSEDLPEDEVSQLSYSKSFPVIKTSGSVITVKGGADEAAVQQMIDFLTEKFFSHEGMHLVEHILLRPKTNGPLFVDAEEETLTDGITDLGNLKFTKEFPILSADRTARVFLIAGDITSNLSAGMTITVRETPLTDGNFTISSFTYSDPATEIVVDEVLVADIPESSLHGILSYPSEKSISAVNPDELTVTIPGPVADSISAGSLLEILGSTDVQNDGRYTVRSATDSGSDTKIVIEKVERLVQDRMLSINLDDDCECALENPYTCMAHVILPYWPGRFTNTDFRTFFEKTLRREAPAHVYLNICWVSCRHIAEFERAYKTWLIENAGTEIDHATLSTTLDELIDSIEQLRNVYPTGTLHDCDEDENLENSIILNHSALGEI